MRKYVADTRNAGATPIVLSLIPRNIWTEDGKVVRASDSYGKWAKEIASEEKAYFIDLNEIVAARYEEMGREKVGSELFLTDHTHTNLAGARINAEAVVEGLRMMVDCPLNKFLKGGNN